MIYLHVIAHHVRGKTDEAAELYRKNWLPIAERHGQKLIGSWRTSFGVYDELTGIYAFESLADLERSRREQAKDPDVIKMRAEGGPLSQLYSLVTFEQSKLMVPMPHSPLQ